MELIQFDEADAMIITAVATIVISISAVITLFLTWSLMSDNRKLRKAGTEPELVVYFRISTVSVAFLDLVLANVGNGAAFEIELELMCNEEELFNRGVKYPFTSGQKSFSVIPAGDRINALFGRGTDLLADPALPKFSILITYKNTAGKKHSSLCELDVLEFGKIIILSKSESDTVEGNLKKISKSLGEISKKC
jgi:hypothetical protein